MHVKIMHETSILSYKPIKSFSIRLFQQPRLERSGHDFELLHKPSAQNLKTRPYSKQQVAKNKFTTEPIFFAIPD